MDNKLYITNKLNSSELWGTSEGLLSLIPTYKWTTAKEVRSGSSIQLNEELPEDEMIPLIRLLVVSEQYFPVLIPEYKNSTIYVVLHTAQDSYMYRGWSYLGTKLSIKDRLERLRNNDYSVLAKVPITDNQIINISPRVIHGFSAGVRLLAISMNNQYMSIMKNDPFPTEIDSSQILDGEYSIHSGVVSSMQDPGRSNSVETTDFLVTSYNGNQVPKISRYPRKVEYLYVENGVVGLEGNPVISIKDQLLVLTKCTKLDISVAPKSKVVSISTL